MTSTCPRLCLTPWIPRCPAGKIPTGLALFTKEITTGSTMPNTAGSTRLEGMLPVPGFGAPSRSGFGQAPVFTPIFTATRMPRGSISWPQPFPVKFITTTRPKASRKKTNLLFSLWVLISHSLYDPPNILLPTASLSWELSFLRFPSLHR